MKAFIYLYKIISDKGISCISCKSISQNNLTRRPRRSSRSIDGSRRLFSIYGISLVVASFVNSERTRDFDRDRESAVSKEKRFLPFAFTVRTRDAVLRAETSIKKGRLDLTVTKTYFRGFLHTRACGCTRARPQSPR